MNGWRAAAAAMLLAACGVALAEEPVTLDACEQERLAAAASFDSYRCFDRLSRLPGGRQQALTRLEALVAAEPADTHARTMLARLLGLRDPRGLELLAQAIEAYTRAGDELGLGWAHVYRSRILMVNLRPDEAEADARAAGTLAERLDDFPLTAIGRFQESRIASLVGDDGLLHGLLRSLALDPRFDTLSPRFRAAVLQNLGSVCGELELFEDGMGYLRRSEKLAAENDEQDWLFDARHSMSSIAMARWLGGEPLREEASALARSALDVAGAGWRRRVAEQRVAELTPGPQGLELLRAMADEAPDGFEIQTALGRRLLDGSAAQRAESIEPLERALRSARPSGMARNVVRALTNLARARLALDPYREALAGAERAMDAVEQLHELQSEETIGALNFSIYSPIYYATIGRLLAPPDAAPVFDDLALALGISERMRSRSLVEQLDRPLRSSVAGELASIDTVQRELRGDEALLSFLLSRPGEGGSWLLVATSTELRAYPLPARRRVAVAVRFWLGLLPRGDDADAHRAAARLHQELLAAALDELPPGVQRLIVVPDGPLHRLPFEALRSEADAPPLLERFEVTRVPSASVWLRLRGAPASAVEGSALLLADPELPQATLDHASLRAFRLADVSIGRLPHAREEVRDARRALGAGELRVGEEASEAFFKSAELGGYRLVHLAAHALIDEVHPDRSAILLAPGGEGEDGLLQAREVLDLDLGGVVVTLSACQSAGGRVVSGEGVMGLARSFLLARAPVVVGGLWPLSDEVTARLMAAFYRGLGEGLPVGEAMTRAKREMHAAGLPAADWAGVVVIGDGRRTPWQPRRSVPGPWLWTVGAIVLLAGSILLLRRRLAR